MSKTAEQKPVQIHATVGFKQPPNKPENDLIQLPPDINGRKTHISQFLVGILIIDLFCIIVGSILVLMELASSGTFELFATIPFPTQVFIVGIVLLGVSILILVLSTLYRYGRNIMLKALYGKSPTPPVEPGARLFKDIIIGLLISILAILIGAIITIANSLSGGTAIAFDVNLSFAALTLGEKSLFVFGIILLFNILVLGTQFLWRNGYKYFMNSIIRHNKTVSYRIMLTSSQKRKSSFVYGVILIAFLLLLFGTISIIMEAITAGTAWEAFAGYFWGFQVVYLGLLGFIVFTFLIIVMYGYKRMNNGIQVALFVHPPKSTSRLHAFTRIIGGTILAAVFLILTSGILWIFYFFVENTFHINAAELFVNITQLEIGWIIITYGIFILLFTLIALLLTFFFKNGYSFILRRVSLTEEKLDQKMERAGEKVGQKFHDLKKVPESKESKTPATKPPASPEKKIK